MQSTITRCPSCPPWCWYPSRACRNRPPATGMPPSCFACSALLAALRPAAPHLNWKLSWAPPLSRKACRLRGLPSSPNWPAELWRSSQQRGASPRPPAAMAGLALQSRHPGPPAAAQHQIPRPIPRRIAVHAWSRSPVQSWRCRLWGRGPGPAVTPTAPRPLPR